MFPSSVAKKLPVYFYGKVKFSELSGQVTIDAPIKRGMIGFGQRFEKMTRSKGVAELHLAGHLHFKSNAHIGLDCFVFVGKDAYCEFGYMGCLGSNVKLLCSEKIILGNWCGIGYESQVIDTNAHPMMHSETKEYYPMTAPIVLGNYNSISNRVSIMMGTKTPNHCVVASNSLCNKDYSSLGEKILLGGVPAKLLKENFVRDWEGEKNRLLKNKRVNY
ncbi:MAG: transferase [Flavobacteriaceae bacterium]|nr:transferase [Flavobacteriaceae bacterium]